MGRLATVLSSIRETIGGVAQAITKVDSGGGASQAAEHMQPPGYDGMPLPGDTASLKKSSGAGSVDAVGYADPKNEGKAAKGESRIYARDEDGNVVAEIWLKGDGTIRIETEGQVVIDSPDVKLSDAAGADVARKGDLVGGSVTVAAFGTPTPFAGQIVSGQPKVKA